jgi:TonB family protein
MKANSRDNVPILKKSSDAPSSKIPIKRLDSPPSKTSQVDQALDRLRKKTAAEPSASSQTGPGQDRQTSANGNSALNDYYRVIWSRIKSQWALPPGILPKGAIEAVVHVRILRNGALTDIGIEKRSGNAYFDDSALRAVKKANPLPPLPEWFRESSLDVGIRFHSSEFH